MEEKLYIEELKPTKKYPFLGFSPNLIDYFLIIGYDITSKNEIALNNIDKLNISKLSLKNNTIINKDLKSTKDDSNNEVKVVSFPSSFYEIDNKPVVLNSIGSDNISAALDEELIIKGLLPDKLTKIYFEMTKNERTELPTQNIILYLKANKIFEFDDANEQDKKLRNDIMFNVYGYLFYESFLTIGNDQKNYRLYFPKIFVFVSQFSPFKYFSFLSQNILFRMKHHTEIPLEIQIYNIINFTPSPINSNLCLDCLINNDLFNLKKIYDPENDKIFKLKKNSDNNEFKNDFSIYINQFTGFPYLDINLVSMFYLYNNIDLFIIIYLFSFLEIKCIFFCNFLDPLNNIMYVLNMLLYPFIDLSELGQIYSVSIDEILDKNKILENYFIGINCEYNEKMQLPEVYKNYIIINLQEKDITMYYKFKNLNRGDSPSEVSTLYHFLKRILNEETASVDKRFLETKLSYLYTNVNQNFAKFYTLNETNDETKKEIFFKELNFSETTKLDFKYKYCEFEENNLTVQKLFYSFNICIMQYFHDMLQLEEKNSIENQLDDKNIKAYYEYNFKDQEDNSVSYEGGLTINFCEEDKIFLKLVRKTKKLKNFIEQFLKKNDIQEIKRPSLRMSEDFMYIDKSLKYDETRDYFLIMSKFYQTSNKMRKINFNKFYMYYSENLVKKFFTYAHETKVIKLVFKEDKTKNAANNKYLYLAKDNLLDNNILQRYSYLLNNYNPLFINGQFPHLKFKENENNLEDVNPNLFSEFLENNLLENKFYSIEDIVSFIILILYIISLKKDKYLFHFFEEISKSPLLSTKCYLRKYIYIILYILDEKVKEKIKEKKNYVKELLIYKEIMASIMKNKEKANNLYYPNELLSSIMHNFNFYQNYYSFLLKQNPALSQENKTIIENYNNFISTLLNEGFDYKVFLQNNTCEDKGAIRDDVLINIMEAIEYKGVIQTTCKTCKFKIKPNLFFIHVPLDKSNSVGFYSIIYSYKSSLKILHKILNGIDKGGFEEEYFCLCANMIYYINFKYIKYDKAKNGINNLLSRFIATSII